MPGQTFMLSEYPFEMIELACEACERRRRLRKARLIEQYGANCGVARLRETLIANCPKFGNWHDPCRAYYVGLDEWWEKQPRDASSSAPNRQRSWR
jgi:hypothetical protein